MRGDLIQHDTANMSVGSCTAGSGGLSQSYVLYVEHAVTVTQALQRIKADGKVLAAVSCVRYAMVFRLNFLVEVPTACLARCVGGVGQHHVQRTHEHQRLPHTTRRC